MLLNAGCHQVTSPSISKEISSQYQCYFSHEFIMSMFQFKISALTIWIYWFSNIFPISQNVKANDTACYVPFSIQKMERL